MKPKKCPKICKILPKRQNYAKSGHAVIYQGKR